MRPRTWFTTVAIALLLAAPARAEDAESDAMVVYAMGAVERIDSADEATLVEIAHELAWTDRLRLGAGAVVSVVPLEGDASGRVVKIRGPAEGLLSELLAKAEPEGDALAPDQLAALREPLAETLDGPGITRAAEKGPLRPVYPAGKVCRPCGAFLFVPGIDDLEGGWLEVRIFGRDPSRGASEPLVRVKTDDSPAAIEAKLGSIAIEKRHWWQVAAMLDGEEAMAGEPVPFTLVASPVGDAMPPQGFDSPEARGAWHLVRARRLQKARLYLDAYREYGTLVAAGGGSSAVERLQRKIEKKLGLDEDDVAAIQEVVAVREAAEDVIRLHDGRVFRGEVVDAGADPMLYKVRGALYTVKRSWVKEIVRSAGTKLASAAPFVTASSRRYLVSTNAGKAFGKEATRHLEALFDAFGRTLGKGLGARNARNLKAVIYRDERDFRAYVTKRNPRQDTAYGWYDTADTTLYLFRWFHGGQEMTWKTLYHEGTHQILHLVCNWDPDVAGLPQYWLSEAIPCYMESLVWKGRRLTIGPPTALRVQNLRRVVSGNRLVPLADYFGRDQSGIANAAHYDQGHAVFWYLMHGEDGKHRNALMKFTRSVFQNRPRKGLDVKAFRRPITDVASPWKEWFLAQDFAK